MILLYFTPDTRRILPCGAGNHGTMHYTSTRIKQYVPSLSGLSGRVLNRFGGGGTRYAANPGLTPSFRRSLPETGCLSQRLPHGKRYPWPCPPKTVKHPLRPTAPCAFGHSVIISANGRSVVTRKKGHEIPPHSTLGRRPYLCAPDISNF